MSEKVLVVDDEKHLVELVGYNLAKEGYGVVSAGDGAGALKLAESGRPDIIVLDIMLPGVQGLDVLRRLKKNPRTRGIPVILLTARSEELDRVLGLELGADDYVTKPFSPRELVARVKAVLRRCAAPGREAAEEAITAGELVVDPGRHRVTLGGRPVELSPREFSMLARLAANRGRVLSRENLLDGVWGHDAFVEPRTVDVHIRRLRAKIEKDPQRPAFIITVRGVGYTFSDN